MSETFLIPDAHGNWRLVLGLLEQEGLVENGYVDYRRIRKEVLVLQIGDLGNCVRGSINDDLIAMRLVGPIIDQMLVGNHEHPYFGGPPFDGFAYYDELKRAILRLNDLGLIKVAFEVDGILITHAGLTRDADKITNWEHENKAAEIATGLNYIWSNHNYNHGMFSAIGRARGGRFLLGSVLWSDWSEPKTTLFPQIFGHTVDQTWRMSGPVDGSPSFTLLRPYEDATPVQAMTLCIDIGAGKNSTKIVGCWIKDGVVELVEHEAIRGEWGD